MLYLLTIFMWIFLTAFFGFKCKQAKGKVFANNARTGIGGGSFLGGIAAKGMSVIWGILAGCSGLGGLMLLSSFSKQ